MNPTFKELYELSKERKIKQYTTKSKEKLCEELGLSYVPYIVGKRRLPMKVLIRRVSDGEESHFHSFAALAKAVGRNTVSALYHERIKKPMSVVGPGLSVPPGVYIVEKE
jgi:hypothetical protein